MENPFPRNNLIELNIIMNKDELKNELERISNNLDESDRELLNARLEGLISVFPFNEYEFMLMFFKDRNVITFEEYEDLRETYVSENRYLSLFELAPRTFGQTWAEEHIKDIDERFHSASKKFDPKFDGEYDLWIDGIKVEVKACRAIHTKEKGSMVSKALQYGSTDPIWMNFQQLKPEMTDVFIFIGVWIDRILYWVLSRDDAKNNPYFSPQHRGGKEYQIGIKQNNIDEFDIYLTSAEEIGNEILRKYNE